MDYEGTKKTALTAARLSVSRVTATAEGICQCEPGAEEYDDKT